MYNEFKIGEYVKIKRGCEGKNYNSWNGKRDLISKHWNHKHRIFIVIDYSTENKMYLLQDIDGTYAAFSFDALENKSINEDKLKLSEIKSGEYYFVEAGNKRHKYIIKVRSVIKEDSSIEFRYLLRFSNKTIETSTGEISYSILDTIKKASAKQINLLDICVGKEKYVDIPTLHIDWIFNIKKGDVLTTRTIAKENPNAENSVGGLGFKPDMEFIVNRVDFHKTDTDNPYAIIFPEGEHGIFSNSIIPPNYVDFPKQRYDVGDYVVLKNERCRGWALDGQMDKYKGNIIRLSSVSTSIITFLGSDTWEFRIENIDRIATLDEVSACVENNDNPTKLPVSKKRRKKIKKIIEKLSKVYNKDKYFKEEKDFSLDELIKKV